MIMTHTEETSTTFESKTTTEQMNGHTMASTERREAEEQGGNERASASEGRHADDTSGSSVLEMGSTDSAGSAHGGGPSCGLVSSLFPSSCRGRAEAFARRLHRRLTSLGGEEAGQRNDDSGLAKETSWLRSASAATATKAALSTAGNHVLQHQPRHNPDRDLCYELDLDFEDGLSSPAEEATAAEVADLVVNQEVLKSTHRHPHPNSHPRSHPHPHGARHNSPNGSRPMLSSLDSESGYVYASPLVGTPPDSDSSDIYFDPESSDVDKTRNEVYFDPIATSDSEPTNSNLSNGCDAAKAKSVSNRRRADAGVEHCEDTSESTCSLRRSGSFNEIRKNDLQVFSSEDSRSSQETTSPSHESLWSTFDESTVSLQDECPSGDSVGPATLQHRLPKSHSDTEIALHGPRIAISVPSRRERIRHGVDEVDFVNGGVEPARNGGDRLLEDTRNARNRAKEESPDSSDGTYEEELPYDEEKPRDDAELLAVKVEENSIEAEEHSTYSSTISIPGALALECSTGERLISATMKNEVQLQIENGTVTNSSDEDKMCLLLKKLATSPTIKSDDLALVEEPQEPAVTVQEEQEEEEEEEEEEEDRPQKIRRCSSLKTGKTPPGTPGRKKIVRFADVLGLDLADVRTFLDEIPKIPNSAYSDLIYDDIFQKDSSPVNSVPTSAQWGARYVESRRGSGTAIPARKLDRTLVPLFQQPGGLVNFLDLVRERKVCLENALVQDPVSLCIQGTVRVINLDYHKSVHIRYTLNSWRNFSDLQATYVPNSCDGLSDKFSFVLYCHTLSVGQRLEFAVRFQCKGEQYWDNNAGANYCFQCLPGSTAVGYIPITSLANQQHEWSPMFY